MVIVFEALRLLTEETKTKPMPVSYASSGVVLGPSSDYAVGGPLPVGREYHRPVTLYGVFKICKISFGRTISSRPWVCGL